MAVQLRYMLQELGIELDESTLKILVILEKKKDVPEEFIAKKLKLKINETRKHLYKLYEKRLATYVKKADPKKKWWYIYHWSLDKPRIQELFFEYKRKLLTKKKKELDAERQYAFECPACKTKYSYDEALETEFNCPSCGALLEPSKETVTAKKLEKEIEALEAELSKGK
jgi:transcription initiation factor TFIIE subunit alpha